MIQRSFVFLERIGRRKEQNLWRHGITDWVSFLKADSIPGFSSRAKAYYDRRIREAQQALAEDNSAFFNRLPAIYKWRLWDHFREQAGFLDIEVDSRGKIVVVGISDYYTTNFFVAGANLEKALLEKELLPYKILVTFNGAAFDLPKLKKQLGVAISIPHIDLKPLCVNLGWKGGLKEVELQLHLKRPKHLHGNPVGLWKAFHASGDREWLDLLLEYNREDVENLKGVMERVWKGMVEKKIN